MDWKHIYDYDILGRFISESVVNTDDNSRVFASSFNYDENNNVSAIKVTSGNNSHLLIYNYGADNLPASYQAAVGTGFYIYDTLNRLDEVRRIALPSTTYEYYNPSDTLTTAMVESETVADALVGSTSYTYDPNGNITSKTVTKTVNGTSKTYTTNYTYDEFNRLYIERNGETNQTTTYKYDAWGNIAKKWVYSGTDTLTPSSDNLIKSYDYVYSSTSDTTTTWKDLLTEYDGEAIVYDAIGNPTTYRGKTMLWNGRELAGFYNSETAAAYTYDASGIRTSKVHYGETYYYYYVEGKLMSESCSQYDLIYTYDSNGNLSGIKKYLADGTEEKYGAVCNIFGDVVALYNSSGTLIAQYNYDTWGKLLSITNASGTDISSTSGIWLQNSIRYRGYVYDNETGWYYLQSRYYDPDTCRFINADDYSVLTASPTALSDKNLFAYCDCNPIVRKDTQGEFWDTVFDAVSLVGSITEVMITPQSPVAWIGLTLDVVCLVTPGLTGGGAAVKLLSTSTEVVDTASDIYRASTKTCNLKKAIGSYEIVFSSGKTYVGKGSLKRATSSAKRVLKENPTEAVSSIYWKRANNPTDAFVDEYLSMLKYGGPNNKTIRNTNSYNKIWSPGKKLFEQRFRR